MLTDIRVVCSHGYLQVVLQLGGRVTESVNECTHLVASRVSVHIGDGRGTHIGGGGGGGRGIHTYGGGGGGGLRKGHHCVNICFLISMYTCTRGVGGGGV